MASFRHRLRRKKASMKSGASSDAVYKPTWYAYEVMERFLGSLYDYHDYGYHPPSSVLPRFSYSLAMIGQIIITCTNHVECRSSNLCIFHLHLLSLE
jgi:hypothetical protein